MRTLILQHRLVRIEFDGTVHRLFLRMSEGGWVEHNPFPGDLRGLVAAMTLATDCIAGKVFLKAVVRPESPKEVGLLDRDG